MNNGLLSNDPVPRTKTYNFYESGAFRKPSWAKWFLVKLIGGGGGGGSGSFGLASLGGTTFTHYTPLGGGGGGFSEYMFHESEVPVEVPITVGVGGAGAPAHSSTANSPIVSGTNGTAGGDTSFGTMLRAEGGRGGIGAPWPPMNVNGRNPKPAASNLAGYYNSVDYMPPAKGLQHGCESTVALKSDQGALIQADTRNFDCGGGNGGHGGAGSSSNYNGATGTVGAGRSGAPAGGSGGTGGTGTPASGSTGTTSPLLPYGGSGGGGGGAKGASSTTTDRTGAGGAGGFPGGGGGASGNNHAPTYAGGVGAAGAGAYGMAQVIAYSDYPLFGTTFSGIPTNTKGKIESFIFSTPGLSYFHKPAWATSLMVVCVHAGSGGNSGSRANSSSPARASGGLGGNSGGITSLHLSADTVGNEVPVFVGTGGAGGLGVSANGTGNAGSAGQDSYFDVYTFKGSRPQVVGIPENASPIDRYTYGTMCGAEPTASSTPSSGGTGTSAYPISPLTYSMVPGAGGNGGSTFNANTGFYIGQTGGSVDVPVALSGGTGASPASTPSNGQDGASLTLTYNNDPRIPDAICGGAGGGGGGVSTDSSPSSAGGAGGWPGGGGGGGAGMRYNTGTSGAGGKGGDALIVVICYGEDAK